MNDNQKLYSTLVSISGELCIYLAQPFKIGLKYAT